MTIKTKPKKKMKNCQYQFNSDWLSNKDLQKWIKKYDKDGRRFLCWVCNKSQIGGKTQGLRHAKNKFNIQNFDAQQHTTDLSKICSNNIEFQKSVMLQKNIENSQAEAQRLHFRALPTFPGHGGSAKPPEKCVP